MHAYAGREVSAEQLASEACEIEIDILGQPIGRQDQYAAAYGGINSIRFGKEGVSVDRINASNEVLVDLFLSKKIGFLDIVKTINKIFSDKEFRKYARRVPATIKDIKIADNWARLKTRAICVR